MYNTEELKPGNEVIISFKYSKAKVGIVKSVEVIDTDLLPDLVHVEIDNIPYSIFSNKLLKL